VLGQAVEDLGDGNEDSAFVAEIGEFEGVVVVPFMPFDVFVRGVVEAEGCAADGR